MDYYFALSVFLSIRLHFLKQIIDSRILFSRSTAGTVGTLIIFPESFLNVSNHTQLSVLRNYQFPNNHAWELLFLRLQLDRIVSELDATPDFPIIRVGIIVRAHILVVRGRGVPCRFPFLNRALLLESLCSQRSSARKRRFG